MEFVHPVVPIEFKEAREFAHLISIYHDLEFVVNATRELVALIESEHESPTIVRSLFTSALVAYVRCFTNGKRVGLTPDIFSHLQGDPLGCHQYYKDMRDKHIAHSVNPFEQMLVGAVLASPDYGPPEVIGVANFTVTLTVIGKEGVNQLGELAVIAMRHVESKCRIIERQVLEIAKTLDINHLYKLPKIEYTAPGGGDDAAQKRDA